MTTTVTVPDHWELHADPDVIEIRRAYWEQVAVRLRSLPCAAEAGDLARRMSGVLHDTAVLLRGAQEQLDQVRARLMRRVIAARDSADSAVSIVLRNPADEVIVAKSVKAAMEIRKQANERLESLAEAMDREILPRLRRILEG